MRIDVDDYVDEVSNSTSMRGRYVRIYGLYMERRKRGQC